MKIAAVQMDVQLGNVASNLERIRDFARLAAEQGSSLVVFPECAVTGYCFDSKAAAIEAADRIPGDHSDALVRISAENNIHIVAGSIERAGGDVFNVAMCASPDGSLAKYRKTHLPHLGVDHFATLGDNPYSIVDLGDIRIGMLICYDASFPEASRALALAGADLIVLPTNWPPGAEQTADYVINARASENAIFYLAANRVGTERGFQFIGKSKICDVHGSTLGFADHRDEEILYADIDPMAARNKRIERADGHWIHRFDDRRPDLYGGLLEDE